MRILIAMSMGLLVMEEYNFRRNIASWAALVVSIYSDSIEESATIGCLPKEREMEPPL